MRMSSSQASASPASPMSVLSRMSDEHTINNELALGVKVQAPDEF
jgi:hypothetical protein